MEDPKHSQQQKVRDNFQKISKANNFASAVRTTIGGAIAIIFLSIGAFYMFTSGNSGAGFLLILMIAAFAFVTWRTIALANKKFSSNPQVTPFEGVGTTATTTLQPYPRTTLEADEQIIGWLGPLQRYDRGGMSSTNFMGTETHRGAENTLFITSRQLIALAFVQADFDTIQQEGAGAFFSQLSSANNDASGQHVQVSIMNYKLWPTLIENTTHDLPSMLQTHYQWGIPVANIKTVEVKNSAINAGIQVHLTDGTILKYASFLKDQMQSFAEAVRRAGIPLSGDEP